jgi:hypothetical protein
MDPKIAAAARTLITQRDRMRKIAREQRELPRLERWAAGYVDGLELALAALAGVAELGSRELLEATLAVGAQRRDASLQARGYVAEADPMGGWEPRS